MCNNMTRQQKGVRSCMLCSTFLIIYKKTKACRLPVVLQKKICCAVGQLLKKLLTELFIMIIIMKSSRISLKCIHSSKKMTAVIPGEPKP